MENKEIVIWHEMDGQGDKSIKFIEQICREIDEKFDVKFRFVCMNISEFIERLNNLEAEEEKPDVIFIPQDMVSMEKAKLSEVSEKYSTYMEEKIWNSMKYKSIQRGVPYLQGNHAVLYYNKKYMKEAPKSFEEIIDFKKDGVKNFAFDLNVAYWLVPFVYTFNGNPVKGDSFEISDAAAKKVTEIMTMLKKKGVLCDLEAISTMLDEFKAGNVATMINGEWLYEFLYDEMGEDIGVCELPEICGKEMVGVSTSVGVAFPWNSLQGEKAKELDVFINYMLNEDVQRRWLTEYRRFPINSSILEKLAELQSDKNMLTSYNQMKKNYFLGNEECVKELWTNCDLILEEVKRS